MIILITGASHTGKTALAQKLLEKYDYPYLSIDHLKMGLIRSGYTKLTPADDDKLTNYLKHIKFCCLIMSENYIKKHFDDIKKFSCIIEKRQDDRWCTLESVIEENTEFLFKAQKHDASYVLIDDEYDLDKLVVDYF